MTTGATSSSIQVPACRRCGSARVLLVDHDRQVVETMCSRACGDPAIELDRALEAGRKPYTSPVITEYGTLADITRASANSGMLDGSPAFALKTGGHV